MSELNSIFGHADVIAMSELLNSIFGNADVIAMSELNSIFGHADVRAMSELSSIFGHADVRVQCCQSPAQYMQANQALHREERGPDLDGHRVVICAAVTQKFRLISGSLAFPIRPPKNHVDSAAVRFLCHDKQNKLLPCIFNKKGCPKE